MSKKKITLHHHHAKPYRKRYVGAFILSFVLLALLIGTIIEYRYHIAMSVTGSNNFVRGLFSNKEDSNQRIHSTYGFDIGYDQQAFYASAIDSATGDLILGADLARSRPYSVVRVTPTIVNSRSTQSAMTLTYHYETFYTNSKKPMLEDLQSLALTDGQVISSSFANTSSKMVAIDSQKFLKSTWQLKQSTSITSSLRSEIVTYVGIINNHPVTIVINYGLGASTDSSLYDSIITNLSFGSIEQTYMPQSRTVSDAIVANRTLLDNILMTNTAMATSSSSNGTIAERVAALYGPTVVKIYNVYCMDIMIDAKMYLRDACNGGITGSGFFVSQDGYIATNGHVAVANPKGLIIQDSLSSYIKGDSQNLEYLIGLTALKAKDIAGLDSTQQESKIIDALYTIDDARITTNLAVNNLLVGLTGEEPDIKALLKTTTDRNIYPFQDTIKPAKLVASDYREVDGPTWGLDGYRASDIAIIKIDGSNYPVTKLGFMSDVMQGSNLMILGYPGNATNNGLVDATNSTVTLTTGKVASIKYAAGSNRRLIETDATIGHGNSGGPVFSDRGDVVGIATYTTDGSGDGGGIFNYIRDVSDLTELASKNAISFDTNSKTQKAWQAGIDNFYDAHYSQALTDFYVVKKLYPFDSRVDEFIATSTVRINNGEDIQDFPTLSVIVSAIIILLSLSISTGMIIRHAKHHVIYKNKVNSGTLEPIKKGQAPRKVHV